MARRMTSAGSATMYCSLPTTIIISAQWRINRVINGRDNAGCGHSRALTLTRLAGGERRQGQGVAVGVGEPGDLVAGWSRPDAEVILVDAVVTGERHARVGQRADGGADVGHLPAGDGERPRREAGDRGEP